MPKKLSELFTDKTNYPDDFVIEIKGESIKLGEWRQENEESNGKLMSDLKKREDALKVERKTVEDAGKVVLGMYENLTKAGIDPDKLAAGKLPTKKEIDRAIDSGELDENDPLVGSLVKRINTLEGEGLGKHKKELDSLKTDVGKILSTYINREARKVYEGYDMPKGTKIDFKEALEVATKNRYVDSDGIPDITKALNEMTADVRNKSWQEQEREKIRKEERQKLEAELVPRPGNGTTRQAARKPEKDFVVKDKKGHERTKTFEEVMQDAFDDPSIWKEAQVQ